VATDGDLPGPLPCRHSHMCTCACCDACVLDAWCGQFRLTAWQVRFVLA
jgi:hypothetical protein